MNGISYLVFLTADNAVKYLLENLQKGTNSQSTEINTNIKILTIKCYTTWYEKYNVEINFKIIDFPSREVMNNEKYKYWEKDGTAKLTTINIHAYSINKALTNESEIYGVVQHELSHVYENIRRHRNGKLNINNNYEERYKLIDSILFSNRYKQEEIDIAVGVYMTFKEEQTGILNELDGELRYRADIPIQSIVSNSNAFWLMEKLELAIKNREKYIDFIENVLNMPFTKYCKMTDKAYSNMQKKLMKIIYHYIWIENEVL